MLFLEFAKKSIVVGIVFGVVIAVIGTLMGEGDDAQLAGVFFGAIIAGITFIIYFIKNFQNIAIDAKDIKDEISSTINERDSEFYAIAEKEVETNNIVQGVWSQALVNAKGDEKLRKIEYMKLRVKQLKSNS